MMEDNVTYRRDPARSPVETERTRNRRVYVPKADIIETGNSMVLYADMPGADEKSVDVTIEKNILTISAMVTPREAEGRSMFYAEYDIGDYERAFTISDEVDRDRIDAVVKNGVLKLTLHKMPQAEARKITVRTE
ncbi:MAG: Hsp20/alpha crystallin family protein [Thermodesulfobacteriota bacterium]